MKELVTDIFFDLDHTLWDFERNSALTFKKIFELKTSYIISFVFYSEIISEAARNLTSKNENENENENDIDFWLFCHG